MKYDKIFIFLCILICFTSIVYSADEKLENNHNNTISQENIITNDIIENNLENKKQVEIEEENTYENEHIPCNNFEDGYQDSEIIEINDKELFEEDEEIITEYTPTTNNINLPKKIISTNNIQTPIISESDSYISAKVSLKKNNKNYL